MTTPMLPRERCDYSAIVDRPPLKLPGDCRCFPTCRTGAGTNTACG